MGVFQTIKRLLIVIALGVMCAVAGGFAAKSAADMQIANNDKLRDSTSPEYNEDLYKGHALMAGSATVAWVGFGGVVALIIGSILAGAALAPSAAKDAFKGQIRGGWTWTGAVSGLLLLGVAAVIGLASGMAIKSYMHLKKFRDTYTANADDKLKLETASRNALITGGIAGGSALLAVGYFLYQQT